MYHRPPPPPYQPPNSSRYYTAVTASNTANGVPPSYANGNQFHSCNQHQLCHRLGPNYPCSGNSYHQNPAYQGKEPTGQRQQLPIIIPPLKPIPALQPELSRDERRALTETVAKLKKEIDRLQNARNQAKGNEKKKVNIMMGNKLSQFINGMWNKFTARRKVTAMEREDLQTFTYDYMGAADGNIELKRQVAYYKEQTTVLEEMIVELKKAHDEELRQRDEAMRLIDQLKQKSDVGEAQRKKQRQIKELKKKMRELNSKLTGTAASSEEVDESSLSSMEED